MADPTKAPQAPVSLPPVDKPQEKLNGARPLDWASWRKRGIVSLGFGVLLAHNVRPSDSALKRLRDAGDFRAQQILSDQFTASLRMIVDTRLTPIDGAAAPRQAERLRQKVYLPQFVAWAIETIDNPSMSPEFRALGTIPPDSASPNQSGPDPWDRSIEILRERFPATRAGDVTRRLQSMARLLVALAVEKHGLEITRSGEESNGTQAAFETITGDAGFSPMDGDTTADALSLAVDLVGREQVLTAQERRLARRSKR